MDKIIVDTDIITEYLKTGKGRLPEAHEKYKMIISPTTFAEILASVTFEDQSLEKEVIAFVDKYFTVENEDKKTALVTARILRRYKISLAQATTAAMALTHSIALMTDNKSSYQTIEDIKLL